MPASIASAGLPRRPRALIWPGAARLDYLRRALTRLVQDPIISVRVCAAVTLRSAYRHDSDFAVDLFNRLCDTDEAVLRTKPIEDFLSVATRSHLAALRPILERMLQSSVPEVQTAGGRQIALATLNDEAAGDLLDAALAAGKSLRLGVAQVAAHNVTNPLVGAACARWLPQLFGDPDEHVRNEASNWVRQLGTTDVQRLRDLAFAFIESDAYLDDEAGMLRALDDSTVPIADVALPALQRFVEHRREEIPDIQRSARFSASIASKLAVRAYTSASSQQARGQALDVIDALLAAKVSEMQTFVESFG